MADDCFGPESGGSATRPLTSGSTNNTNWIVAETECGAGDGSRILELLNSFIANFRNVCRLADGDPLINDDPCDTVIADALSALSGGGASDSICDLLAATDAEIAAAKTADLQFGVCVGGVQKRMTLTQAQACLVTPDAVHAALAQIPQDGGGIVSSDPTSYGTPAIGLPGTPAAGSCYLTLNSGGGGG